MLPVGRVDQKSIFFELSDVTVGSYMIPCEMLICATLKRNTVRVVWIDLVVIAFFLHIDSRMNNTSTLLS